MSRICSRDSETTGVTTSGVQYYFSVSRSRGPGVLPPNIIPSPQSELRWLYPVFIIKVA
jgi:hypothetical protein